jgi:hypothetical protein
MSEGKGRVGSSFDDFLKDEGLYEEVSAGAIKRVLARRQHRTAKDQNRRPTDSEND